MVVVTISVCPPKLRGDLSKWLFAISPGVYVGVLTKRVREKLWMRICSMIGTGRATMVYKVHNEQRFEFLTCGTEWKISDYDGIQIMKRPCIDRVENNDSISSSQEGNESFCKNDTFFQLLKENKTDVEEQLLPSDAYVVIDIETTGLDPIDHSIIQIGAIKVFKGEVKEELNLYVQTNHIPEEIIKLTGITTSLLDEKGIPLSNALRELKMFVSELPIVGYNVKFDVAFLEEKFRSKSIIYDFNNTFDALSATRFLVKELKSYKLKDVLKYFGIENLSAHNALSDAKATFKLVEELNKILLEKSLGPLSIRDRK